MSEPANQDRADRVYELIDGYQDNESLEECIIDLLTDLQHLCDSEAMDFTDLLQAANNHYLEEVAT